MEEKRMEKEQKITVKIGADNTELMAALDEIEKKVDLITAKLEKLGELTGRKKRNDISGITVTLGDKEREEVEEEIKKELEKQLQVLSKLSEKEDLTVRERLDIAIAIKDIAVWLK